MASRPVLFVAAGLAVAVVAELAGVRLPGRLPMPGPQVPSVPCAEVPPAPGAEPTSLADIQRLASDFAQTLALYRLAGRLDVAGIERLLDEADAIAQPSERDAATSILYERYADLDPAAALRHIRARGGAAERWLGVVFHAWARSDLAAALGHAETLDDRQRHRIGDVILRARDDLPPEARAEVAALLPPRNAASDMMERYSRHGILPDDPVGAWRQALNRNTAGNQRFLELSQTAFLWSKTDPHAALAAIESAGGVSAGLRISLRSRVVTSWMDTEPTAALAWAKALSDSQARSRLVNDALNRWADRDPRAAAAWLSGQDDRSALGGALHMVASSYATRHPEEALAWAAALPAHEAVEAVSDIYTRLSVDYPERAAGLLARIEDAPSRRAAEETLVRLWSQSDPYAVVAWLDKRADSGRRAELYAMLLLDWPADDIAGASRYLDRLADAQTRERVAWNLFHHALHGGDVPLAETLFDHLQTEGKRHEAAELLYGRLRDVDPDRPARRR